MHPLHLRVACGLLFGWGFRDVPCFVAFLSRLLRRSRSFQAETDFSIHTGCVAIMGFLASNDHVLPLKGLMMPFRQDSTPLRLHRDRRPS